MTPVGCTCTGGQVFNGLRYVPCERCGGAGSVKRPDERVLRCHRCKSSWLSIGVPPSHCVYCDAYIEDDGT